MDRWTSTVTAVLLTGLFSACASGPQIKARDELKNAHHIDYLGEGDLNRALLAQRMDVVKLFFQAHDGLPKLNDSWRSYWRTEFSKATKEGHVDLVRFILPYATDDMKNSALLEATPYRWKMGENSECDESKEEIMKLVIEAGAEYPDLQVFPQNSKPITLSEDKASEIAESLCPKATEMVLKKYPRFSAKAAWNLTKTISSGLEDVEHFLTAPMQGRIEETLAVVKSINKARCDQGNEENCGALKTLALSEVAYQKESATMLAKVQKENELREQKQMELRAKEAYESSPEGQLAAAVEAVCTAKTFVDRMQAEIDAQHEIGRDTGVVNKQALYDAGMRKRSGKSVLEQQQAAYRQLTGKDYPLSKCRSGR